MSSGGGIAAWAYDGIISSGVNRWGRDVHCIVDVLGKSSHTHMLVIVACKYQRVGDGLTVLLMDPKGLWPACYVGPVTRVSRPNA